MVPSSPPFTTYSYRHQPERKERTAGEDRGGRETEPQLQPASARNPHCHPPVHKPAARPAARSYMGWLLCTHTSALAHQVSQTVHAAPHPSSPQTCTWAAAAPSAHDWLQSANLHQRNLGLHRGEGKRWLQSEGRQQGLVLGHKEEEWEGTEWGQHECVLVELSHAHSCGTYRVVDTI